MSTAAEIWVRRMTPRWLRNWLRDPRASLRWLGLSWRWRRQGGVELDCGGGVVVRCHPASARTFQLFVQDPDSIAEFEVFRQWLAPGARLYDLGAHYGFFSVAALALGAERVLAVEPSAAAARVLRSNLKLAAAGMRAQLLQAAVGVANAPLAMLSGGVHSENYMFAASVGRSDAVLVPALNFSGLEQHCGWRPTLVKLDIEGFERAVLTSPVNLDALRAWRVPLLLELHNAVLREEGHDPASILEALASAGYGSLKWRGQPVTPAWALTQPVARLCLTHTAAAAI